jgi:hypothetical protein
LGDFGCTRRWLGVLYMSQSAWRSANRAAGEGDMIRIYCFTGAYKFIISKHMQNHERTNRLDS